MKLSKNRTFSCQKTGQNAFFLSKNLKDLLGGHKFALRKPHHHFCRIWDLTHYI